MVLIFEGLDIEGYTVNAQPQFITNNDGQRVAVILSLADYEELLEDLEDLAAIAERKNEPTTPLDTVLSELGL